MTIGTNIAANDILPTDQICSSGSLRNTTLPCPRPSGECSTFSSLPPIPPPPRQIEALDSSHCAALHNSILEHAWLSSGRSAGDFEPQCAPYYERAAEAIDEKCSASLKAFFQRARDAPRGALRFNFFWNVSRLDCAFGWHGYYSQEEDRALTPYTVSEGLYGDPDGLVYCKFSRVLPFDRRDPLTIVCSYDQRTHKAMMHFDIADEPNESKVPGGRWKASSRPGSK